MAKNQYNIVKLKNKIKFKKKKTKKKRKKENSFALPFFGIGMKTDLSSPRPLLSFPNLLAY